MYKKNFKGKKAVLFDLDGTIIDSEYLWDLAFKNVVKNLDLDVIDSTIPDGTTVLNKWKQVVDEEGVEVKLNPKQLTELTTNEFFKIIKEVPLDIRDGFWELAYELKEIKKLKIGLVTNTDRMTTMQVLKEIGVSNTFDLVVCGDDVKNPKPDPEIYKLAAKKLNLNSRDILVFEDSVPGAEAAVKAGIEVIVIWDQTTARGAYPQKIDVFVPDFLPFPGNLDLDFMDKFNNVRREYEEFKKSKGQSKP